MTEFSMLDQVCDTTILNPTPDEKQRDTMEHQSNHILDDGRQKLFVSAQQIARDGTVLGQTHLSWVLS